MDEFEERRKDNRRTVPGRRVEDTFITTVDVIDNLAQRVKDLEAENAELRAALLSTAYPLGGEGDLEQSRAYDSYNGKNLLGEAWMHVRSIIAPFSFRS